jgi:tetratricopeptide (TPR) repeat protein
MSAAGWYLERGNYEDALFYYLDAVKIAPEENVNAYLGVANAAEGKNDKVTAKNYYQKAVDFYNKEQGAGTYNNQIVSLLQDKIEKL